MITNKRNEKLVAVITLLLLCVQLYSTAIWVNYVLKGGWSILPVYFYVSTVVFIVGVIGIVQFIRSSFRDSQLISIFLMYEMITVFFGFIDYLVTVFLFTNQFLQWVITDAAVLLASSFALSILSNQQVPESFVAETGERQLILASKTRRFFNRFFDLLIISMTVYNLGEYWTMMLRQSLGGDLIDLIRAPAILLTLEIIVLMLYYTILEYFFQTTFGKLITNTTVVDEAGMKPLFSSVLIRTLCRFIPFDSLSFLFGTYGWHDQLSKTYVLKAAYRPENT